MHCHLALIKLLDYAKEIGILDYVRDDGRYWETRSADVLVANLRENDRIVAAVVGALNDQIGEALDDRGYVSIAPIQEAPDFEYLEAEGRAILGDRAQLSPKIGSGITSRLRASEESPGASILAWPAIDRDNRWPPLAESIQGMQRLNPELGLRIAPPFVARRKSASVIPLRECGRSIAQTSCSGTPSRNKCARSGSPSNSCTEIWGIVERPYCIRSKISFGTRMRRPR